MKKLLLVLAIGAFAACNDSATSTETTVDSTTEVTVDTTMQSTTPDSLSTGVDSAAGARVDSVHATPAH
jgi:hypothetical protein